MKYNLIFNAVVPDRCRQKLRDFFEKHHDNFEKYLPDCDDVDVYVEFSERSNYNSDENQTLWGQAHITLCADFFSLR